MTEPLDLPASVLTYADGGFTPVERVLSSILRNRLPDLPIRTLIEDRTPGTFALVRRAPPLGFWQGDPAGFVDFTRFFVHTYTQDPDGDEKGAVMQEAIRKALTAAWREQDLAYDGSSLRNLRLITEPNRKTDWANSSGPVQFADLPAGMFRYEAVYRTFIRRPR